MIMKMMPSVKFPMLVSRIRSSKMTEFEVSASHNGLPFYEARIECTGSDLKIKPPPPSWAENATAEISYKYPQLVILDMEGDMISITSSPRSTYVLRMASPDSKERFLRITAERRRDSGNSSDNSATTQPP